MNKEQARKHFLEDGKFKEIKGYDGLYNLEEGAFPVHCTDELLYFKPVIKETLPKLFEASDGYSFKVYGDGSLMGYNSKQRGFLIISSPLGEYQQKDLEAIKAAVKCAEEQIKKNGN